MLAVDAAAFDVQTPLAHYAAHGFAHLGPVLTPDGIATLSARAAALMADLHPGLFYQHDSPTGRYEDLTFGDGWQGPSPHYRKIEKLEIDPLFRRWIENPLFERIARAAIDGPISLYRAVLFTKSAAGGTVLPWHQDGGLFWGIDRDPTLQIWTALDDTPAAAGCVEVIPHSHLRGLARPQGGMIPDAAARAADADRHALPLPARAGEALLLHNHLWHRSGINHTGHRRSALSLCFMPATTKCLRKRRAPREFARIFE